MIFYLWNCEYVSCIAWHPCSVPNTITLSFSFLEEQHLNATSAQSARDMFFFILWSYSSWLESRSLLWQSQKTSVFSWGTSFILCPAARGHSKGGGTISFQEIGPAPGGRHSRRLSHYCEAAAAQRSPAPPLGTAWTKPEPSRNQAWTKPGPSLDLARVKLGSSLGQVWTKPRPRVGQAPTWWGRYCTYSAKGMPWYTGILCRKGTEICYTRNIWTPREVFSGP